jgi:flagellar protein FlbD
MKTRLSRVADYSGEALLVKGRWAMIKLTRFKTKDHEFLLNAELIETVEETPDTVITLVNGNKVIVEEDMDEIMRLVIEYRRSLNRFGR